MASSTSFEAVNNSSTRFYTQRINRRLDDRDNVIKEAIAILEEKDSTYFPTVHAVTGAANYSASNLGSTQIALTLAGAQLGKSTDDISVSIGGVTANIAVSGHDDSGESALILTLSASFAPASSDQGDLHLCQIRINDTLATEFMLQVQ